MGETEHTLQRWRRNFEGLIGIPATEGNRVDILRNGDEIFPAMLEAIDEASETVDFLTYVYWTGDIAVRFAAALGQRARAGVRVRILLDAVGAATMNRDLIHDMEDAGCVVEWFRPPTTWKVWEADHRTHRKVLICDEEVAFTGGVGIAEEWEGDGRTPDQWRDTHFRVRGPAVDGLRAAFVSSWKETGQLLFDERDRFPEQPAAGGAVVQVVASPAQIGWTNLATVFTVLLCCAKDRIRIATAYFVPGEQYSQLLIEAANRGVEVDVLVPGRNADKRVVQLAGEAEYEPLMRAGVRIWCYQPTMLHAKILTVDGLVTTVGSGNFDQRSMRLNDEANLVVFDEGFVAELDRQFDEDLGHSEQLDLSRWGKRSAGQRILENAVELVDHKL